MASAGSTLAVVGNLWTGHPPGNSSIGAKWAGFEIAVHNRGRWRCRRRRRRRWRGRCRDRTEADADRRAGGSGGIGSGERGNNQRVTTSRGRPWRVGTAVISGYRIRRVRFGPNQCSIKLEGHTADTSRGIGTNAQTLPEVVLVAIGEWSDDVAGRSRHY